MKNVRNLLLVLAAACACVHTGAQTLDELARNGHSTAAGTMDGESYVATIKGRVGIAVVNTDKVELRDRTVYVNGKSYGKVPEVCEVRYVVTKEGGTLFVDGQPRPEPVPRR
ncbi:sugar ABC transporter ATPase [Pseudoduganella chitinolytica]|uniref:Sugar ABC transporter ATPase n=1 Tax=Pseudoduganella chitinolytica TaxID=34070 RepID=A0ABY8BIZ4_9BURK|nr:sugar ABC transporter ATPase [Pseudoduganella chitinolytica]WEF34239.1 sugar ABC transporter ATPase [Pseudoduganella chitinolytica]